MATRYEQFLAFVTKYITPAIPMLVVLGIMWGIFIYTVHSEIQSAINGMSGDVGTIKTQISALQADSGKTNDKIDSLLKDALDRAWPKPSPTATKAELQEDFKRASDLLQFAQSQNVKLDPRLLSNYGKLIGSLNKRDPVTTAWETLPTILNYRSYLNADFQPSLPTLNLSPTTDLGQWHTRFGNRGTTTPKITT